MDERIKIVNEIIEKISTLDRMFFHHKGTVAYIFRVNKQLYMRNEYNGVDMLISAKSEYKPKHWSHGGTLWGLTKDFVQFIKTGTKINGDNGYGGLFCSNWGYSQESMLEIQKLAKELGYL